MSYLDTSYINLDSINNLKDDSLSALKMNFNSGSPISPNKLYLSHLSVVMADQLSQVQKEGRKLSRVAPPKTTASCCSSSPTTPTSSIDSTAADSTSTGSAATGRSSSASSTTKAVNTTYGAWGLPSTDTAQFDSSVPDTYDEACNKLLDMMSWQRGNWDNTSNMMCELTYMVNFTAKYGPNGTISKEGSSLTSSSDFTNFEALLVYNMIAGVYTANSDSSEADRQKATQDAINQINAVFSTAGVTPPSAVAPYLNYKTYQSDPTLHTSKGTVIPIEMFQLNQISALSKAAANGGEMDGIQNQIYAQEFAEVDAILDDATLANGDMEALMQLIGIIAQKETDTENEISGCASMLRELGGGETATGNAEDALSVIVCADESSIGALTELNKFLNAFAKNAVDYTGTEAQFRNNCKKNYPGMTDKTINTIEDLASVLEPIYKKSPGNINYNSFDSATRARISDDINNILDVPEGWDFMFDIYGPNLAQIQDDLEILSGNSPTPLNAAQTLSQSLLLLFEMGEIYGDSIFPGLKDITEKLLGPNGDFYSATGLTQQNLIDAANGDTNAEQTVINGIKKIVPTDDESETEGLSLINNELNEIATYFNDQNASVQTEAQYISSNDEKLLAFMKELYDQPIKFNEALNANLQRSSQ